MNNQKKNSSERHGIPLIIVAIVIISIISITIFLIHNKQDLAIINKNSLEETLSTEEANAIDIQCEFLERLDNGFKVNVTFTGQKCINSIKIVDTDQVVENDTESDNQKVMTFEFDATQGTEYNIQVTMASSEVIEKTFLVDSYIPENNQAPSLPVMTVWPEITNVKLGRNVTITALSTDPEGHAIQYEWEGRESETAQYEVGEHTVRVKAIDFFGAESEWASYTFTVLNIPATTVKYEIVTGVDGNFNILGVVEDNEIPTTAALTYYNTRLVVDGSLTNITGGSGSKNDVNLTTTLEPVWDDSYVKITYTVTNTTSQDKVIGISTYADVKINQNDAAVITNMSGDKGFTMTDGVDSYKVMLRDTQYVTDVDTYWFGDEWDMEDNLFNSSNIDTYNGEDSGFTLSWKDRTLPANATQTYSFIIGLE